MASHTDSHRYPAWLCTATFFGVLFLLHAPLLRLPYFWDEAGYYVPAARDLLYAKSLIPVSTPSNAHPPLAAAYLALMWALLGFTPAVTRTAMLLVAAFSLAGLFRLAQNVANREVAVVSVICTALYPVFFVQSSLAHLDLAAAGLTFWGLSAYVERRPWRAVLWFSLAALAKETASLAPLALLGWESIRHRAGTAWPTLRRSEGAAQPAEQTIFGRLSLLFPLLALVLWYGFHYWRTGFVFGNPEFFRYNVQSTVHPLRIFLALGLRLWQVLAYMNLYVLTVAALLAMWLPPIEDAGSERPRIAVDTQFAFLAIISAYVAAMAVIGGAVLARYMLPAVPLVVLVCVSTLWRRVRTCRLVAGGVALAFTAALFTNPPYGFSIEDNLAYRDYTQLHQKGESFLEARYPMARVLTAWPASDEITRPYLGYVTRPMHSLRVEDFTVTHLSAASAHGSGFDVVLVFSTKYQPPHPWFEGWALWQQWKTEFFGYHRDAPPAAAARILGGKLVYEDARSGQWLAVIEMERIENAQLGRNALHP